MGGTGALWRPIAAHLEEKYSVLAPDQRGHGESRNASLKSFSPIDFAQDVLDTMESLSFHPAWIAGHSMGMRTACAVAHLRPGFVKGLILIDLGFSGPAGGGLGERLASFLKELPMVHASRADARAYMEARCPDASMGQYLMAVGVMKDGAFTFPFDREALLRTLEATKESSVRDWIWKAAERGLPVLNLRGANSGVYDEQEFDEEKKAFSAFENVEFIEVPNSGHGLPFEQRAEFLKIVERFTSERGRAIP